MNSPNEISLALIDLDGKDISDVNTIVKIKDKDISDLNINEKKEFVFYMVQEMEAWFLSQPEILEQYFGGVKISAKIPQKSCGLISNPSDFLQKLTKNSNKGKYHKVKNGVPLLCKLDIDKLTNDFEDVKSLIEKIIK